VNIQFACPVCERPARLSPAGSSVWQCPGCDHLLQVQPEVVNGRVETCAVCGNHELYKKKDFPHWLGLTILAAACLAFILLNAFYRQWLAWTIFIGSAAFDGLLYLAVGDAIVCYRCGAHYRGLPTGSAHDPFELGVAERYRQERLRRAQLWAESNPRSPEARG
jgi:uncharacterized membrane protein (DUF485 family)